jgi:hypothetical protein
MKTIKKTHLLIFVALALILVACAPAAAAIPQTGEEPQAVEDIVGKCLRSSDDERLLINFVNGYCVRYPAEYDIAYSNQSEIMLIKRSILNVEDPRLHITVKPSEGKRLQVSQIARITPSRDGRRAPADNQREPAISWTAYQGRT